MIKHIYTTLHLKYPASTPVETILDHALASSLSLATHRDPSECDPHLAVSVSVSNQPSDPSAQPQTQTQTQTQENAQEPAQTHAQTQESAHAHAQSAGDVSVVVARLWRSKAQAQSLRGSSSSLTSSLDSKQLEKMLKEHVASFQGFDANVWSASLGLQLRIILFQF